MKKLKLLCILSTGILVSFITGSTGLSSGINNIKIDPDKDEKNQLDNECHISLKDTCFWKSAEFHVTENTKSMLLGRVGPTDSCKRDLNYHLVNGSELVSLHKKGKSEWLLSSQPYLNRDESNMDYNLFTISCSYNHQVSEKSYALRILDVNDNPPLKLQNWDNGSSLLAFDMDTPIVNNYVATLTRNYSHIFDVHITKKELYVNDVMATGLYCDITMKNKTNLTESYFTSVLLNDTSLLPPYGPSALEVPVKLQVINPDTVYCKIDIGLSRMNHKKIDVKYLNKPIILSTSAAPFTRLTQPINASYLVGYNFSLNLTADHIVAFNITPQFGIIYLRNISLLVHPFNSTELEVMWINEDGQKGSVKLKVVLEDKGISCQSHSLLDQWSTCSESTTRKNCTNTCGLGTGTISRVGVSGGEPGGCRWLDPDGNKRSYSTCVPDPETCPDKWCDPLEELHERLCPQDCSTEIMAPAFPGKNNRGIKSAKGVCSCDPYSKCVCYSPSIIKKNNATKKSVNLSTPQWDSHSATPAIRGPECGAACLTGVVAGSLLVTAAIAMLFIICRTRWLTKTGQRNRKLGASQAPIHSTDTLLTIEPGQSPTVDNNAENTVIDSKWEFSRDQLEIESCLGEGEFGRVLRARAHNIAGMPGVTTVAVKTLKDNAGPAELADLLSEYQMLKDISHPNVIRLLGASTTSSGPVYLIMEFAHHGSLKSYLRRHRKLEGRQGQGNELQIEEVTPRDIVSFSWQISKGMAYLSDMKLVHRDLAARNILVASGKICKVSDFGLTRDIYEDDTYLKRSKGRVPVKWMALESLADHIYTSKSDIWSFGILLWELVTLGSSPYPGVAVHNLFYLLRAGYRMEKPENCSHQLYDIMRSCWQEDPMERPSFKQLTRTFDLMLEDGTDYLDLTSRFVYNRIYFTDLPQQGTTMEIESSSDNEEEIKLNTENMDEDKLSQLRATVDPSNMVAHYENEKVTLGGYESPKHNHLNSQCYVNLPKEND